MATMQIISVLASLLLFASAAPEYRRSVPPEPVSEHPAFSTTEEPRHYSTTTGFYTTEDYTTDYTTEYYTTEDYTTPDNGDSTPDYGYTTSDYYHSTHDYSNDVVISCGASLNEAYTFMADDRSYVFTAGGNFTDGNSTDGNSTDGYYSSTDGYYSNNQRCTLTFVTTESRLFEIRADRLQLEYSSTCYYDSVCFGGTKNCGNWPENGDYARYYPVPANQSFTIDFKTDSSVTNRGFEISIKIYPFDFTSPYYAPTAQYATSPNDFTYSYISPENYVDTCGQYNSDQSTNSYYNTDNFSYYSTEDYQYTTSNPQDSGATIVSCDTGNTINAYMLYPNSISTTDSYNSYNSYSSNNQQFIFRSSNYGNGSYNNNERCTLIFYTLDTPKSIQIYFSDFDVENSTGCVFDKVCINGVKYCSNWTRGYYQYYTIPAHSSFTIYSLTDSSVAKRGFELRISEYDTTTDYPSYSITSGDGSSEYSVSYDYVYASNYVDRCSDSYDTLSYPNDQPSTPYYDTASLVYDPYPGDGDVSDGAALSLRQIERNLENAQDRIQFALDVARNIANP